jgi:hypothetical protein
VRWHLSLSEVTALAWVFVALAWLLLPGLERADPQSPVRLAMALVVLAGFVAFPVAAGGSIVLLFRRLSRPPAEEHAADYDDEVAVDAGVPPDRGPLQ